ncbi:50S ribosomal protein L19e [Candidatus Woesearchaeota archaeon CG10_big_fil_rev_8_21_14_0_10_36_11]|nr:MAG: 50S ribosomal protein L19e [Candidatus Woesearchaeota archaeon CG10_big_fil_rev_8_21_14_0_10_36_11]
MRSKKRLAGKILKVSPSKVRFAADALDDIKKAITRSDIRGFIATKKIVKSKKNLQSKSGARKIAAQKKKGRQKGRGSRKGSKHSNVSRKELWMKKVRVQRIFLKDLREKKLLTPSNYRSLYAKSKGGYFRNRRHIKLYVTEHNLWENK